MAISQGDHEPPRPIRVDAQQPDGTWVTVHPNLGFPSGKTKTVLIDLEPLGTSRRLRLHTNMEIFWDAMHVAPKMDAGLARQSRLNPALSELRYRGFSQVHQANASSPELPDYSELSGTSQVWRDLVGYYTRFGDVQLLLEQIDDRYVIMNAGDELVLRFAEAGPVPEGYVRDFVLIGDGWVKDGDYNTSFSTGLRPLPAHDQPNYDTPPGLLTDDPVYLRYPADWIQFHTRYVTPDHFSRGLRLSP